MTALAFTLVIAIAAPAQPKYRTFSQADLSQKKTNAGKVTGTLVSFTLKNTRLTPVQGVHVVVSSKIVSVIDSGGFPNLHMGYKRMLDATGRTLNPGDSLTFTFVVEKTKAGTVISYYWWTDAAGNSISMTKYKVDPVVEELQYVLPNGGNVREFLYKKVLTRPTGLVLGIETSGLGLGWIRNMSATAKYFPHTGTPRCLDYTVTSSGKKKAITKQIRNVHYKKHDNHLLGELHALKLAIAANDAGITEPTDPNETRIGDLLYNDGGDPSDPFNGLTIRQAAHLVDSALSFCGNFDPAIYAKLDSCLTRINSLFAGPYRVRSYDPFVLEGSASLSAANFLHANPDPPPALISVGDRSIIEGVPDAYRLSQNFPNPFNPTTSFEFSLAEPSIVTLKVYDMLGREVASLIDGQEMEDGAQLVDFDADELTSGIYFYRLTARSTAEGGGTFSESRKMTLIR